MKITELIEIVNKNIDSLEFSSLIAAHIESPDYMPYNDHSQIREFISNNIQLKNNEEIIRNSYSILQDNPIDIESHILIAMAAKRLNKISLHNAHNFIASNLIDQILKSGDGRDFSTAYNIFYPQDQIAMFSFFKKYPIDRINQEKNERYYDIYVFQDNEKMYFDVTVLFKYIINNADKLEEVK
ncbi:MAG: hypothetical protein ACD_79C00862G0005 [uncultured bacterium]|nr:MAG: hypothetical protein ACD_79C00862G0005 [uncultured bacterium]